MGNSERNVTVAKHERTTHLKPDRIRCFQFTEYSQDEFKRIHALLKEDPFPTEIKIQATDPLHESPWQVYISVLDESHGYLAMQERIVHPGELVIWFGRYIHVLTQYVNGDRSGVAYRYPEMDTLTRADIL